MSAPELSVSLHFVYFHFGWSFNGFNVLEKLISSGKVTGKSLFDKGTGVPSSKYIIGIGHPQYLCLEILQSFNL